MLPSLFVRLNVAVLFMVIGSFSCLSVLAGSPPIPAVSLVNQLLVILLVYINTLISVIKPKLDARML